jgi:GrpB-like predicted nucleotidyltransferase (UPF0157 family)
MTTPQVVLVDYDPQWPARFARERERIVAALGALAMVEHVGSTAVPGVAAKPIIDIMVGVRGLPSTFEKYVGPLQSVGYEYVPTPGISGRWFFQQEPWGINTHHLHLVEQEGAMWEDYSMFRDHLRTNPKVAQQYVDLKRRLAALPGIDRPTYSAAKGPFINGVVAELLAARATTEWRYNMARRQCDPAPRGSGLVRG